VTECGGGVDPAGAPGRRCSGDARREQGDHEHAHERQRVERINANKGTPQPAVPRRLPWMIATGAIVGVVLVAKQTRLRLSSTVCSNHLAWGSMFRRLTSSASVALSGRALFTSRQLLARVSGGLAAALPAGGPGTRRDQARVGVVVLRATVCAAIRLCRRAHAGSDPVVSRADPVRRGVRSGGARER
jgi:hypothetical protein